MVQFTTFVFAHSDFLPCFYIGITADNEVYRWGVFANRSEALNLTIPMIDFSRTPRLFADGRLARTCIIPAAGRGAGVAQGQIICGQRGKSADIYATLLYNMNDIPLMTFTKPLTRANQITTDMNGNVCILMDGQLSCIGT
jgi:hypothetical protein